MKPLQLWQWLVLIVPIVVILLFLLVAAGLQIHHWHLSWIWAVVVVLLAAWRWALVHWVQPPAAEFSELEASLTAQLQGNGASAADGDSLRSQAEAEVRRQIRLVRSDALPWEDWALFFRRCQDLIVAIAHIYAPDVQRPLLNIYIPQAYGLLRDTVDDLDRWMAQLSPALGQVTVGQAYRAYETYQKLEPAARTALRVYNWARWVFNPLAAIAFTATQPARTQANQKLLSNLGQLIRETALTALGERAIALYSGQPIPSLLTQTPAAEPTQSLQTLFAQAEPTAAVVQKPVQILIVGRTGAGKSSVINTLFAQDLAQVDVLPSTDQLTAYRFTTPTGAALILWDTPGYEQVGRPELRDLVLDKAQTADLLLLVTPALDPALAMDRDFLETLRSEIGPLPTLAIVSQVDRLRPIREWQPPYDWQTGDRPKEQAILGAVTYRQTQLADLCTDILPLVTGDQAQNRPAWGQTALTQQLLAQIEPAQQLRLARFLEDQTARMQAAAQLIDRYATQMSTAQGLTQLLKSPILTVLSTLMTGNSALAATLATGLPIEEAPIVMGKLQMAWELFSLLTPRAPAQTFDLLMLWPLLLERHDPIAKDAWALGHALVEYWLQATREVPESPSLSTLQQSYHRFLQQWSETDMRQIEGQARVP